MITKLRTLFAIFALALCAFSAQAATFSAPQKALILANIAASPDLNVWPNNGDGNYEIARLYNLPSTGPALSVWQSAVPVVLINDAIDDTKFTPADVPLVTQLPAESMLWLNRSQMVLIKQANLQRLLQGRDTINATKATVRANLRDALIALPTGVGGANTSAGGASASTVLTACTRIATRLEKLLTSGPATTGSVTADIMGREGEISNSDVNNLRAQ